MDRFLRKALKVQNRHNRQENCC